VEKFLSGLEKIFGNYPFSVIFTNIFAVAFSFVIAWLCYAVSLEPLQQVLNTLLALTGALIGWALGMFFAPYTQTEAARFSSIGQAVSAFVSGYVISKLDRFLEATMFQEQIPVTITWMRFGLIFCSMLLVMLTVFSNRAYFRPDSTAQLPEPQKVPQPSTQLDVPEKPGTPVN
jgi:glucan phosphoethanolaminetransferase (alkaline phosphatase superfamily)